jgi:hypothetical protein
MGLMTIDQMATDLQGRLPMNLDQGYCFTRLNQAFGWIEQQGSFSWGQRIVLLTLTTGQYQYDLTGVVSGIDLTTVDIGKIASIWPSLVGTQVPIPWRPVMELGLQQVYNTTPIPGVFSMWTWIYDQTVPCFQIRFAPTAAAVTTNTNYALQFHAIQPDLTTGQYFPTPHQFDQTIIDLAEAEIRRIYGLAGWDAAVKKSQASAVLLCDPYRSDRQERGINAEGKETQEATLVREQ